MFFTTVILLPLQMRKQSGPKQMFMRMRKACKQSPSRSKLKGDGRVFPE